MPSRRTIWLRRAALMAVIAIVVGVPATLAIRAGDAEEEPALPQLRGAEVDRALQVGYRVPRGWRRTKEQGTLRLQSRDRTALIAIAAPGGARDEEGILGALFRELRRNYRDVEINRGRGRQVGGLDARGAVVSARQPRGGGELRILVAVARGERRTYVVEVFTSVEAPPERLVEAQRALNSLRLRG